MRLGKSGLVLSFAIYEYLAVVQIRAPEIGTQRSPVSWLGSWFAEPHAALAKYMECARKAILRRADPSREIVSA